MLINLNTDNYRLKEAKATQDAVLGEGYQPLMKKALAAPEAPHLDTGALISKLDEIARIIDLDASTSLAKQIKDPVFGTVRSWLRKVISPQTKSPKIQQPKGLLRYCQEIDRLLIEDEGHLLGFNEPSNKLKNWESH